ncbi:hypothetical protein BO99DRAFT_400425 [Aspergillus violaceofuscus CBS 115571]|uniref:Uncharacterized protein n=1 Tax=Aspergillus violaceofuscus (strain CBS 115571) TaxID=1450538 RepID=A0A2V5IQC6_ASPV1|nr:hypothetical protein BO99DRAFT_400425 [Aspergillus violaceofuscus CBS 115571]
MSREEEEERDGRQQQRQRQRQQQQQQQATIRKEKAGLADSGGDGLLDGLRRQGCQGRHWHGQPRVVFMDHPARGARGERWVEGGNWKDARRAERMRMTCNQ